MSKSLFQRRRLPITVARISRLLLVLTLFLLLCWPQQNLVQAAGGDLDFTFGDRGLVNTDFNSGDELKALAVQPDGKIIAVGFGTGNFALARYNTDSTPDFSFGSGGKVDIRFLNTLTEANAVALQPDGKIVVAGRIFNDATGNDFVVARYNPDGSLDSTFGPNGAAIADFGGLPEIATSVAIQPDGKIVVAGFSLARFALARFNPDGSLDTTFGSGGKVVTNFFGSGQSIHAIAIDSNSRIVVAGRVNNPNTLTSTDFAVARYRSDGSLDPSFGSGGLVTTDFFGREDFAFSMMIQPDERIVLAGYAENLFERKDFALARYNRNGSLDTTFGSAGKVSSDLFKNVDGRFGSTDLGFAAAIQFDGKIIVAGKTINEGIAFESRFALARYNSEGSLDTTFGSGGIIATSLSGLFQDAQAIAIQDDGKIVVGGQTFTGNANRGRDFALLRYFSSTPKIISATVSGKKLLISGEDFGEKAVIIINGIEQKTSNDGQSPATRLIGKKAGKKIKAGDRIQIRNRDRALSPEFIFLG